MELTSLRSPSLHPPRRPSPSPHPCLHPSLPLSPGSLQRHPSRGSSTRDKRRGQVLRLRGAGHAVRGPRGVMLALQGYVLRLIGTTVASFTPENLVASTTGTLSLLVLFLFPRSNPSRALSSILLLLSLFLTHYLPSHKTPYHDPTGYASLPLSAAPSAPISPLRGELSIDGSVFKDREGRDVLLRGVNLGGSTKLPYGAQTWNRTGFFDTNSVTFVGRPFPLEEAGVHFTRLRAWGLTFVRFLVTWEAVEHAGPGIYDEAYLDYLLMVVRKAGEYGISVFIDPHQDVWSRWTGGDGAPAWTLEKVGFNISSLFSSGAAITHQEYGDPYPRMMWPSNHQRLATGTMFTLFFAGRAYAPDVEIEGENVQDYLQKRYIASMRRVARKLKKEPNVVGFDTLNEPNAGMAGWSDVTAKGLFRQGWTHSWWQAMLLGEGYEQEVEHYRLPFIYTGTRSLNKGGVRAWKDGVSCVWRRAGVWKFDEETGAPTLLRKNHFEPPGGQGIMEGGGQSFVDHHMLPFYKDFIREIRAEIPDALIFIDPNCDFEDHHSKRCVDMGRDHEGLVWAPHWYDFVTLIAKEFRSWGTISKRFPPHAVLGDSNVVKEWTIQLEELKTCSEGIGSGGKASPTLVGEIGIPFDLNGRLAFETRDWSAQTTAMDFIMQALDSALLSATLWNYTPDNTNARGDGWNDEDLSIFSVDQQSDKSCAYSGGRALAAVVRPTISRCAGTIIRMKFDISSREFIATFRSSPSVAAPTVVFVPAYQYPAGYEVQAPSGTSVRHPESQQLLYTPSESVEAVHEIRIRPAKEL